MKLEPGTRLGRYEVIGILGAGGMGEVYRARDTGLDRSVAIKVLPGLLAIDADCLRRFEQEARAAAALAHPGILAVYDIGMHDKAPYIVMELLEGATLRDRLSAERLSVRKAVGYAGQVAEALAAAHEKGIVHRDLKPENLFVTATERVKILDFGLAKLTARPDAGAPLPDVTGTLPNTVLGTVGYMAPEQARGKNVEQQADIFSFGCVLYEMLQGQRAFSGATPLDTISAILTETAAPLASSVERPMPAALELIVRRCLEKDPRARFQSASDLAFALDNLALATDSSPAVGQAVGAPDGRTKWTTRGKAARLAAPVLAVVMALALGVALGTALKSTPRPVTAEFLVPPPSAEQLFAPMPLAGLAPTSPLVGLSPDGRWLAFVASDAPPAAGNCGFDRSTRASREPSLTPKASPRGRSGRPTAGLSCSRPTAACGSSMSSQASWNAFARCRRRRQRFRSSPVRGVKTEPSCSRSADQPPSIACRRPAAVPQR